MSPNPRLARARALGFLCLFAPFTLACSLVAVLGARLAPGGAFAHRCARRWSRGTLALARTRLRVTGAELIPPGPVVFMSNHQGNLDIPALTLAIPRRFAWLAKAELFRIPVFGAAMRAAGYIPIDRAHGRQAHRGLDAAVQQVGTGVSLVVFPEGTFTRDGSLLTFKPGGFLLAGRAGAPVVPVSIDGSLRVNPPRQLALHPGIISVTFGAPLAPPGRGKAERAALAAKVRAAILAPLGADPGPQSLPR